MVLSILLLSLFLNSNRLLPVFFYGYESWWNVGIATTSVKESVRNACGQVLKGTERNCRMKKRLSGRSFYALKGGKPSAFCETKLRYTSIIFVSIIQNFVMIN